MEKLVAVPEEDMFVLQLIGTGGPRVYSTDLAQYGLFSAKIMVSPVVGAVSAAYVSVTQQPCVYGGVMVAP